MCIRDSPESGFTIEEIEPRLFSFNNPAGACKECDGLGYSNVFVEELIIPNKDLSFREGVIAPWANNTSKLYTQTLESLGRHYGFDLDTLDSDWRKSIGAGPYELREESVVEVNDISSGSCRSNNLIFALPLLLLYSVKNIKRFF